MTKEDLTNANKLDAMIDGLLTLETYIEDIEGDTTLTNAQTRINELLGRVSAINDTDTSADLATQLATFLTSMKAAATTRRTAAQASFDAL